jgi:hypothetical protein
VAAVASTGVDFTGVDFTVAGFTVAGFTVAGFTVADSTEVGFTGMDFTMVDSMTGRFHDNRFFFGGSFGYPWWGYYPDYGYYDYSQPYSSQTWYYCSDPAGYYPYVTQCNTGWQAAPAG